MTTPFFTALTADPECLKRVKSDLTKLLAQAQETVQEGPDLDSGSFQILGHFEDYKTIFQKRSRK